MFVSRVKDIYDNILENVILWLKVGAQMQFYLLFLQVRSAFLMAFTTLTDPKVILSLGPNRSILGTIIRPDAVLMERKGGSNGEMTFNSLLPGAGEPIQQQYGEHDMLCNWQLDFEEEPLPRGDGENTAAETSTRSSKKKRKSASKENKENRDSRKKKENGSMTENGVHKKHKKKRAKHIRSEASC
jgi:non-canonical poly(A) RNA polymerase PAPD5/7